MENVPISDRRFFALVFDSEKLQNMASEFGMSYVAATIFEELKHVEYFLQGISKETQQHEKMGGKSELKDGQKTRRFDWSTKGKPLHNFWEEVTREEEFESTFSNDWNSDWWGR